MVDVQKAGKAGIFILAGLYLFVVIHATMYPQRLKRVDGPALVQLDSAERAQYEERVAREEQQLAELEKKVAAHLALQKARYDAVYRALVNGVAKSRLHPDLFKRLSASANLHLLDNTDKSEIAWLLDHLDSVANEAFRRGTITRETGQHVVNRTLAWRQALRTGTSEKERLLERWSQFQEEVMIDEWQLSISTAELHQKILEKQLKYDLEWGSVPAESQVEPFMLDDGTIEWRQVEAPARPPRPELPVEEDPYTRSLSIPRKEEGILASGHAAIDALVNSEQLLTRQLLQLARLQDSVLYFKQLLSLNARPARP